MKILLNYKKNTEFLKNILLKYNIKPFLKEK